MMSLLGADLQHVIRLHSEPRLDERFLGGAVHQTGSGFLVRLPVNISSVRGKTFLTAEVEVVCV